MVKFIFMSLLFCISINAAAEWSAPGNTSRLRLFDGKVVLASLSSLTSDNNQIACGNTDNAGQFSFSLNQNFSRSLLSMLLSTELTNRQVHVHLTGNCVENRPEINGVEIVDN